ncbi:hypothetical protein UFOVP181_251 [uncultured Caudovirales phage]|uniref:Uncharacterized protein n=1 Tax=uncultured Caudovirales phage TaxID=2100421 RepID=A0A6J5KYB6_9CAUD|nr:hypothetical protein UFOVP57_388 [uncultured Caudovirales phage]CAB5208929.1 hypothetical protein UFOVP181_251 [uncultured Caudovirales phage]
MSTHEDAVDAIKKAKNIVDALDLTKTYGEQYAEQYPDAKKHKYISFVKSAFRIVAGLALAGGGWLEMNPYIQAAGLVLVLAEVLGIAEELV